MLTIDQIPAFANGDLSWGSCSLEIERLPPATNLREAWALLPPGGTGVVVRADSIQRYAADTRSGLLLEAEVVVGTETTNVRASGQKWMCWKWKESPGSSHRFVEHIFLSSEPGKSPPCLRYREYWQLGVDNDIQIWKPLGARFCGFGEAK